MYVRVCAIMRRRARDACMTRIMSGIPQSCPRHARIIGKLLDDVGNLVKRIGHHWKQGIVYDC